MTPETSLCATCGAMLCLVDPSAGTPHWMHRAEMIPGALPVPHAAVPTGFVEMFEPEVPTERCATCSMLRPGFVVQVAPDPVPGDTLAEDGFEVVDEWLLCAPCARRVSKGRWEATASRTLAILAARHGLETTPALRAGMVATCARLAARQVTPVAQRRPSIAD